MARYMSASTALYAISLTCIAMECYMSASSVLYAVSLTYVAMECYMSASTALYAVSLKCVAMECYMSASTVLYADTMDLLQARVSALDSATLDQVEARLQSVLGKMNEIAKHKAAIEDAETQSKVSQLYDVVQKWDSMATILPQVVQRLIAVKELHEQGIPLSPFSSLQTMQFGQLLTHLDTTQQMINNSLKDNTTLLSQVHQHVTTRLPHAKNTLTAAISVQNTFANVAVQQTMKENLQAVEENFAALDQRMKKLTERQHSRCGHFHKEGYLKEHSWKTQSVI
ncbi:hypothetical protein JZ751_021183 [Albula glossodonta]|uniref:Uncharacterized protein n=1 Tax=Albula glossodonta TaxID=121402 RepID=A0A8T2NW52_9TELE|nr:hypothetical protein JZ751_021183 [Albula glossodonta]